MSDAKKNIHEENVIEFVTKLKQKYHEEYYISDKKNNLPLTQDSKTTREDSIYRPDILVKDKKGNIIYIIEIETQDGGKSLIGALFLANACISKHIELKLQDSNIETPKLVFVILGNKNNATKRIDAIKPQLDNITHLDYYFCTKEEANNLLFGN